ncbi:MAG: hypothetical protein WEA80_02025 [Gemmatimonadaceae bacterium]
MGGAAVTPKKLFQFGQPRRAGYVRAVRERVRGRDMIRVLWKDAAGRHAQSFDDTRKGLAEAKAFAQGVHEQVTTPARTEISPISLRELFDKYLVANMDAWRPRTLELQRQRWAKFELFAGRATPAHLITREKIDEFKRAMVANDHSVNQVKISISYVTAVFRWGVDRDLIPPTKVMSYRAKFGRDAARKVEKMAEYSADERARLIAQFSPRDANRWRAYALTTLIGLCGPRQQAARSLEWRDIELDEPVFVEDPETKERRLQFGGRIHWRPELDKIGSERWQPMPEPVAEAFWVAYGWAVRWKYMGRWIFFAVQQRVRDRDEPWTYQAAVKMLHDAEARCTPPIPHIRFRAYHGFRRGISGDIYDATGSEKAAADWIGDKSMRVVRDSYLLQREEAQQKTAAMVGAGFPKAAPAAAEGGKGDDDGTE